MIKRFVIEHSETASYKELYRSAKMENKMRCYEMQRPINSNIISNAKII